MENLEFQGLWMWWRIPRQKLTTEEFKSSLKNANGLYLEFIVKNGKLTRLNFRS